MKILRTISALIIAALCLTAQAQDQPETVTATKCFTSAPSRVMPLLPKNTRLDMVDYFEAGSDHASENAFQAYCRITAQDQYSLTCDATETATYQLFVLNPDTPTITIGVIETVATPYPDSSVKLYNKNWVQCPDKLFAAPKLSDWLTPQGKKHRREVEQQLPFILASYAYDPSTQTLTVTNQMNAYYLPNDRPEAMQWVRNDLHYKWDGKKFKLLK